MEKNGVDYVNVTNHDITMLFCDKLKKGECSGKTEGDNFSRCCRECDSVGEIIDIPPCGVVAQATMKEERAFTMSSNGIEFIQTYFKPKRESEQEIAELEDEYFYVSNARPILIGSIIAAQAYPERVFGMVSVPGYERVHPDEKLVRSDKFITFKRNKGG